MKVLGLLLLATLPLSILWAGSGDYVVPVETMRKPKGAEIDLDGILVFSPKDNQVRISSSGLANIKPGQYELIFKAAATPYNGTNAGVRFITYCKNPSFRRQQTVGGMAAPRDGSPFETSFTLTLEKTVRLAFEIDVTNNYYGKKWVKGKNVKRPIKEIKIWPIRLKRLDHDVIITDIRSKKVYYQPGEAGSVTATIRNFANRAVNAKVDMVVLHQLANAQPAPSQSITLPAGGTKEVTFQFPTDKLRFGCEARIRVREGKKTHAEKGDYFSVHDEFWAVGLGGTTRITGHSGLTKMSPELVAEDIAKLRRQYVNWWEKIFWPPDDWGDMTPETESWMSGQSARWESATNIKTYVAALKPHGIKSITYGKHVAMGPAGWEMVRRKPDWFYHNSAMQPKGRFHTEDLYTWNDLEYHSTKDRLDHKTFHGVFWIVSPDLRQERVVLHGINEMIESSKRFGWDGVRFDGHWTAGNDALSTHNMRLLKTRLRGYDKDYLFGFNFSWSHGHHTSHMNNRGMVSMDHEFAESMAGGGMYMQEAIGHFGYAAAQKYSKWSDYAKKEVKACRGVNQAGGHYYFIYRLPRGEPVDKMYKFVLGTAAGAHPVYGAQNSAPGSVSWPRFLTRWSAILFDKHARSVDPKGMVEIKTPRPLWWEEWTRERVVDAKTRHLIVHLINPPASDALKDKKDPLPPIAKDVKLRVKIPAGQTLRRVLALDPKESVHTIPVKTKKDNGHVLVAAGDVAIWRIFVFEFNGNFTPPQTEPFLTKAPDPKEVEAGRTSTGGPIGVDPMRPEITSSIKGKVRIVETDKAYNSVGALSTDDGDALNGVAQHRPANMRKRMIGKSWAAGLKPGKYVAHFRIKIVDKGKTPAEHRVSMRALFHGVWDRKFSFGSNPSKYKGDRLLKVDGKYHYYPIPFEMPKIGSPSWLGVASTSRTGDNELFMDHIAFQTVEIYTDAKLEKSDKTQAPTTRPGGSAGLDVFIARGWTWDTYGLDKLYKNAGNAVRVNGVWAGGAGAKRFPQKHDLLYKNDVVVLCNVSASGLNYEGRRALKDFVKAGGGLVILGGVYTLGNGGFKDTFLDDMVPVETQYGEVKPLDNPTVLSSTGSLAAGISMRPAPSIYWLHDVKPRPDAKVHLKAGNHPLLITKAYGRGRIAVFAGTVLGEKQNDDTPFWEWSGWPRILDNTIKWAAGK